MERLDNLPKELHWNIMKYISHPVCDIIRPHMKVHPTARLMHRVIRDSDIYMCFGDRLDIYGIELYPAMIIVDHMINHAETYHNDECYDKGFSLSLLQRIYGVGILI